MELWKELLAQALSEEEAVITFPQLRLDAAAIVEGQCYQALKQIKEILEDTRLEDSDCFLKIESIISTLEILGSDAGSRHDF